MTKFLQYTNFSFLVFLVIAILTFPNLNSANEILIYADNINYSQKEKIVAKGNAKVFRNNQLIISDLIIFDKINKKIILPTQFTFKDDSNNFFQGSNAIFDQTLEYGEFEDIKIRLNDGSRIVGKSGKRMGDVDIISKGVYSPCKSRIKIANFICPTWQLEGEKILHDNKNLFLYQKHSKMRVLNTPIFYIPYIVTPSPLRKNRKSGFLSPSLSLNFFDTKTSQSTAIPYYFNISIDKELTFTPIIKYGGGTDSSQRFMFDYNQITSGGDLSFDLTFDSNFEKENNNKWLSDASLITKYNTNINQTYRANVESALETSKNYIQITNPNDDLSYSSSLSTKLNIEGFNVNKQNDNLLLNLSFYQTNQKNEDNKTTPTVLPFFEYYTIDNNYKKFKYNSKYNFYNIFRDKSTDIHSKNQQKLSHKFELNREIIKLNSKITFKSELYNQLFETEDKLIESDTYHSGSYYRLFPIAALSVETPFKFIKNKYDLTFKPKSQIVITPGLSNSNKISNEDSSINTYSIDNFYSLNRFSGNDKLDNSKRIDYGFSIYNDKIKLDLAQTYEFTNNSNYHIDEGNNDNLSDLLGSVDIYTGNTIANYDFRYDFDDSYLKKQNVGINSLTKFGELEISYLDQKSKVDNIIITDTETVNYTYKSKKFNKFSKVNLSGLYDLKKEINTEYTIGYSYFDECFGINLDFTRKSYEEENLKPQDILTLMFSFKNIGSYKSTNLAVSEADKQDIEWEGNDVDNSLFEIYEK